MKLVSSGKDTYVYTNNKTVDPQNPRSCLSMAPALTTAYGPYLRDTSRVMTGMSLP